MEQKQYPYPIKQERSLLRSMPMLRVPPSEHCFRLWPQTRLPFDTMRKQS